MNGDTFGIMSCVWSRYLNQNKRNFGYYLGHTLD